MMPDALLFLCLLCGRETIAESPAERCLCGGRLVKSCHPADLLPSEEGWAAWVAAETAESEA